MPIKSLESFLFESKLVSTSSIEILENATIGIDVEHYLSRIYTFKKEQFLYGIGGVPSSLKQYLQSDLQVFSEANIRPLFVLPGLKINFPQRKYQANELSAQEQHLDATWTRINLKQAAPGNSFGYSGDSFRYSAEPLSIYPFLNDIIKLFIECDVDYMVSPYDTSFQLSYLYRSNVIDCIYGSTDLLITNIDRFILGMEFQSKDFRFVDKPKILSELNLTERQFLDLSIMVGCCAQPETFSNFPPIPIISNLSPFPQMNYFRMALDILFQYATANGPPADLFGYISSLNESSLLDLYYNGHTAIKFMPILNLDGHVDLFLIAMFKLGYGSEDGHSKMDSQINISEKEKNSDKKMPLIPGELHCVLSQRLPSEIYYFHSLGLIPLKLLEAIISGHYRIRPPLATGDGDSYKKLISSKKFQTVLDSQFNLITQLLARYYQVKKIEVDYWFQKNPLFLNNRTEPPMSVRLRKAALCEVRKNLPHSVWSTFHKTTTDTSNVSCSEQTDVLSASFRRALFLMQIYDENGASSVTAQIMERFCEKNPNVEDKIIEDLFLLLLYFEGQGQGRVSPDENFERSLRLINTNPVDAKLTLEEINQIFLISTIFSTQKFDIRPINYQGPISRTLLAFRSHIKVYQEMAQSSLLVCFLDLVVKDEKFKSRNLQGQNWREIISRMPFYSDLNNTLLGVVSQIYFGYCLKLFKSGNPTADCVNSSRRYLMDSVFQVGKPSHNINLLSVNSVSHEQLETDFAKGMKFWALFKDLAKIAKEVDVSVISETDFELIKDADEIVQKFQFRAQR